MTFRHADQTPRFAFCVFNAWRKGEVAEGKAGSLVRMAEGQSVTYKITKKLSDMRPIAEMPKMLAALWKS